LDVARGAGVGTGTSGTVLMPPSFMGGDVNAVPTAGVVGTRVPMPGVSGTPPAGVTGVTPPMATADAS
jgi:hypothetical protein